MTIALSAALSSQASAANPATKGSLPDALAALLGLGGGENGQDVPADFAALLAAASGDAELVTTASAEDSLLKPGDEEINPAANNPVLLVVDPPGIPRVELPVVSASLPALLKQALGGEASEAIVNDDLPGGSHRDSTAATDMLRMLQAVKAGVSEPAVEPESAAEIITKVAPVDTKPAVAATFGDGSKILESGTGPQAPTSSGALTQPGLVAAAAGHHAHSSHPTATPVPAPLSTPLGDPRWAGDFGQKVVWVAQQGLQSAQLSISPANLGPIDITLNLSGDQATALFNSANADVREALESALPRLREMLAGAGIQLGDARVGAQNHGQQGNENRGGAGKNPDPEGHDAILSQESAVNRGNVLLASQGRGLVDTFA
jgi:flagellar hook-length control protein FliK